MIPEFLTSLAVTVRGLVRDGKAVHVIEETAAELELLAGLPWEQCRVHYSPAQDGVVLDIALERSATPADLALGWLLCSRCEAHKNGALTIPNLRITTEEWTQRAAECAELAALAAQIRVPVVAIFEDESGNKLPADEQAAMNELHGLTEPVLAHDGTREGARAAWAFVVERFSGSADSIEDNTRKPDRNVARYLGRLSIITDHYKRELEAMR